MGKIVFKTMERKTTVSRLVARKAILEAFGKQVPAKKTAKKTASTIKKNKAAGKTKKTA